MSELTLDQRGSAVLGEDACRRHLASKAASKGTGRLAVNGDRSPHVIPVNFSVVNGGILIRLGPGWAAFHLDGATVTFETDEADFYEHTGWSVIVEGVAHVVTYDEIGHMGSNLPTPIVTVPGVRVFEIAPFRVTGRAVEPNLRAEHPQLREDPERVDGGSPKPVDLSAEAAHELLSALRSAHWDVNSDIGATRDPVQREALLRRRRLLEQLSVHLLDEDIGH